MASSRRWKTSVNNSQRLTYRNVPAATAIMFCWPVWPSKSNSCSPTRMPNGVTSAKTMARIARRRFFISASCNTFVNENASKPLCATIAMNSAFAWVSSIWAASEYAMPAVSAWTPSPAHAA